MSPGTPRTHLSVFVCLIGLACAVTVSRAASPRVDVLRVPDGGIQPQVAVDAAGEVHLIYFKGEAGAGDVFYRRTTDNGAGKRWTDAVRVNSEPGTVVATGNMRGAHLAIGREGRVHVAWMGSVKTLPNPKAHHDAPMLYTRLDPATGRFEPQRNVIKEQFGLDGGGSLAADANGNVWVVWHAGPMGGGEQNRRVWVARSRDDGATFATEVAPLDERIGSCACCGLSATADPRGGVAVLYRAARTALDRDMTLITWRDGGDVKPSDATGSTVGPWRVGQCPASTSALASTPKGLLLAWETERHIYVAPVSDRPSGAQSLGKSVLASGLAEGCKYPALAVNADGQVLVAWTQGMAWARGGSAAWQVFSADLTRASGADSSGEARGVPTWSLVAAWARKDGSFVVMY